MIASEILDYYGEGKEEQRLTASLGRLERNRTWEIMERHLPSAPSFEGPSGSRVHNVFNGQSAVDAHLRRREDELETTALEQLLKVGPDRLMSLH
ncbi:MAG TPA: hypothetical protein VM818_14680 [Vicinamibacterales bacterium]|nr:hypothetical protein [Vicinamibacterales bacterium]